MRSFVRSISVAGGVLLLAGAQHASAQIDTSVEFTTSFPFTVGNARVPAGTYSIRQDEDNPQVLELSGGRTAVLFETGNPRASQTPAKTEVVFNRYGDSYVLKDVWVEGSDMGYESIRAEAEKHAAKRGESKGEQRVAGRKKADTSKSR
jgi:hypothetical protein